MFVNAFTFVIFMLYYNREGFMKNFFCFLLICLFLSPILVSCNENEQLDDPILSYNMGIVSWDEIEDAEKYEVFINDKIFITYDCCYQIPINEISQHYIVKVKAISENKNDSNFSKELSFDAKIIKKIDDLSININNNNNEVVLSWSESNCSKYQIFINDSKYESTINSFITNSSYYSAGENKVSVLPIGSEFDIIPEPIEQYVEKSQPLPNTYNIRIENGKLLYGENSIYDTKYLPEGKVSKFVLSNIENNKICSDGPIVEYYKVSAPDLTGSSRRGPNNSTYIEVTGIAPEDCDSVYIEILSTNMEYINYGGAGGFGTKRNFAVKITEITRAHYVRIYGCKNGCISSNPIYSSIA